MALYRKPMHEPKVGDLRCKTWSTLPGLGLSPEDPLWADRCRQYWELQGRLYGWKMSAYTMAYDMSEGFVSTYCTILEILPGERTDEHWRVTVVDTQVKPLVQQ